MRKQDFLKTVQLIIYLLITAVCLFLVFTDSELYHAIKTNVHIRAVFVLTWLALGVSYFFIYLDFSFLSHYKKDFRELDHAVHSDPVAGIANRYSCDALIEKYLNKSLPDCVGCMMLELTNLTDVNHTLGYAQGTKMIQEFAAILAIASQELCFVGRNGGNKFLAFFEEGSEEKFRLFLDRVNAHTQVQNDTAPSVRIIYGYGTAFQKKDRVDSVINLIALSNSRLTETEPKEPSLI